MLPRVPPSTRKEPEMGHAKLFSAFFVLRPSRMAYRTRGNLRKNEDLHPLKLYLDTTHGYINRPPFCPICPFFCPVRVRLVSVLCPFCVRFVTVLCPFFVRFVSGSCPSCVRFVSVLCPSFVRFVSVFCPVRPSFVRFVSVLCPSFVRLLSGSCPVRVRFVSVFCPACVRLVSGFCPVCLRPPSFHWSSQAVTSINFRPFLLPQELAAVFLHLPYFCSPSSCPPLPALDSRIIHTSALMSRCGGDYFSLFPPLAHARSP